MALILDGDGSISGVTTIGTLDQLNVTGLSTFSAGLNVTSGDVGIGTDDPGRRLTIQDTGDTFLSIRGGTDVSTPGILFGDLASDSIGQIRYYNNGDALAFETNSAERVRIGSAGTVTVYNGNSNTGKTLGQEAFRVGNGGGNFRFSVYPDGSTVIGGTGDINSKNILLQNDGDATFAGNVGINSTAPERRLDVLETASQTVAQFQTTGQTKTLTRYECVGDQPVFVGAARSDFNIEMGGTDCMTIDHSNQNVSLTGNVIFPDGKGINFGASQGGGASSDLLDDYEEGTWTPIVADESSGGNTATTTLASGLYTKTGRSVTICGQVELDNISSLNTARPVFIRGIPYTAINSSNIEFIDTVTTSFVDRSASVKYLTSRIASNGVVVQFVVEFDNAIRNTLKCSELSTTSNSSVFKFTMTYFTA